MKFVIIGEVAKLAAHIADKGGDVVKTYSKGEEETLRDPKVEIPEADYLLNCFSPVILKAHILDKFKNRALNVHNGKLPQYAGIHVHQWAIRNGETDTAVTVHHMTTDIDCGDIVQERTIHISTNDTGLSLFQKTLKEGVSLMTDVVDLLLNGQPLISRPQDISKRKIYYHKDALDPLIDWSRSAEHVRNFIRAGSYHPFQSPTYTATIPSQAYGDILILKAKVEDESGPPFHLLDVSNGNPLVACGEQSIRITLAKTARDVEVDWSQIFYSI